MLFSFILAIFSLILCSDYMQVTFSLFPRIRANIDSNDAYFTRNERDSGFYLGPDIHSYSAFNKRSIAG